MADSIDQQIRLDLANETVRCYGELPEDFPQKMAKRLKRKFHSSLDAATILALADHFKRVYKSGSLILRNFITSTGEYASPGDIKINDFVTALAREYPHEDRTIVKTVCDWLIYYKYLK